MALAPIEDGYAGIATALYGDGAWEIVKMSEKQRKAAYQANIAGNTLATIGGAHALALALEHKALPTGKLAEKVKPHLKPLAAKVPGVARAGRAVRNANRKVGAQLLKHPKLAAGAATAGAAGWVGLHGAELAADVSARRAIKAQYKSGKPVTSVHKRGGFIPVPTGRKKRELHDTTKAKLIRVAAASGQAASDQTKKELVGKAVDFTIKGEISKSNDKRQVFGWASVVELNGEPIVDLQGDYMAIDVIEKAAYDYVHSSRRGGDMHAVGSHASDLIESFIVTPEKKQQLGLPDEMPVGWWVGFQVNDEKVWEMVKDGKRPEFSIHGSGQRVDVEI